LFESGKQLMESGQYADACPKLDASQRLDPAVGTLLHLGDCYERIDKLASAWAAFREAASLAEASSQQPRFEIATTRANALAPKLSFITIHAKEASGVPGLVVTLASLPVPKASWEVQIPVDSGEQIVTATAPGYASWSSRVTVREPGVHEIDVPPLTPLAEPEPLPAAPVLVEPPKQAPSDGIGAQRIVGIVIGSVGLAGLTAGGAFGIAALLTNEESLDNCRPQDATLCSERGVELRDRAGTFATTSTVALITGGALAAGGLVIVLAAPSREPKAGGVKPTVALGPSGLRFGASW
jgi:hypothetical protein